MLSKLKMQHVRNKSMINLLLFVIRNRLLSRAEKFCNNRSSNIQRVCFVIGITEFNREDDDSAYRKK